MADRVSGFLVGLQQLGAAGRIRQVAQAFALIPTHPLGTPPDVLVRHFKCRLVSRRGQEAHRAHGHHGCALEHRGIEELWDVHG